ncbi:hypothetical protein COCOBI_10-0190 [Coccomyxa sp. Obi]|nr:hypothetical protein COCOBI_10-0190 [Coccomyxa sp. Obi]
MIGGSAFLLCATAVLALAATPELYRQSSALLGKYRPDTAAGLISVHVKETCNGCDGKGGVLITSVDSHRKLRNPDLLNDLDILFVLDPNFYLCWEIVTIHEDVRQSLLPWVASLKDVFTATKDHPQGLDLQLPAGHHMAKELRDTDFTAFKQVAEAAMAGNSSSIPLPSNLLLMYQAVTSERSLQDLGLVDSSHPSAQQVLHLTTDHLKITSEDNFWSTMLELQNSVQETKTGIGAIFSTWTGSKAQSSHHLPSSLAHTVVILPRIVPSVRNLSPERTPTDDFTEWDVPKLAGLVENFCSMTGATTLPSLPEWTTLPDKKRLHSMYMDYFEEDPSTRTPPIPTVFMDPPGTKADMESLCHNSLIVSSQMHLDATMRRIYEAMLDLDKEQHRMQQLGVKVDRISLVSSNEREGQLRHFIIKREFAEGAILVKKIKFPADALPPVNQTAPTLYRGDYPWRARPPLPSAVPEEVRASGLVTTEPYLAEAAQLLSSRGCGEGWLLQPHIIDMPDMEYRVYLLGGAESSGTSKDAVMVYTPSILDEGLYIANVTIREGYFWSDIIQKPGEEPQEEIVPDDDEGVSAKLYQDRDPWQNDRLHRKIIDAALSGARAMAAYQDVPLWTVRHMYARMDVVLAVYWGEDGKMYVQTLINEMDWFNSAGVMMRYWPVDKSQQAAAEAMGPKFVPIFLKELALTYDAAHP